MKIFVECMVTATALAALCGSAAETVVETWRMTELTFESARSYDAGGGDDVRIDCAFSNRTDGTMLRRPGFWDGGNVFRVRFAPVSAGEWSWATTCADDPSIAGRSGEIRATAYKGPLALYRHGFVRTVPGKKHFVHADGTPFFYLGDTHWGLYKEEIDEAGPHAGGVKTDSHFKYIVDRRAAQGFTVLQSEPIGAKFNVADGRVDASDIPGFRLADRYYRHIADAGLVHANAEFFFAATMKKPLMDDKAALERLSRYWVARFGAWPVMWTLAQEADNDFYAERGGRDYTSANNPWVDVAEFIHRHDAYSHPLSAHQENTGHTTVTGLGTNPDKKRISGNGVSAFVSEEVARRTGHDWWAAQWSPSLVKTGSPEVPSDYWASQRPAVNYEGRYCYLWTKDYGARAQGWISFLSGFCGYGYGAIDMWLYLSNYDVKRDSHDGVEKITVADKAVHWSTAIEFPSAIQMGHMKKFFTSFDWWRLAPILGEKNGDFLPKCDAWHAAKTDGAARKFAFYFHSRDAKNLLTGAITSARGGRTYTARWFDTSSGEWSKPVKLARGKGGECALPPKPDARDWALLVEEGLEGPFYARFSPDAPSCLYKSGAKARVEVCVKDKQGNRLEKGVVEVWADDGWTNVVWRRKVDLSKEPAVKMELSRGTPGSLRLHAKGVGFSVRSGFERVIFDADRIMPLTPSPDDFEAYWRGEQKRLEREVPIDVKKIPAPDLDTASHTMFRVSFATFGGHRIYGILAVPKGEGRFPVIVNVPGAGPGQQSLGGSILRPGWITLMMNVHGIALDGTQKEYKDRFNNWFKSYTGPACEPRYQYVGYAQSREAPFYHRTILGMTRALDWLAAEPYANPSRFVYYGCSQGGGFGLYLSAMWGKFARTASLCPNKCDMLAFLHGREPGSSHIKNQKPENVEAACRNAVYHDNCNFARMIRTPVWMMYGTADDNCQTVGGIAAFNMIPSKEKKLSLLPGTGHGWHKPAGLEKWLFAED